MQHQQSTESQHNGTITSGQIVGGTSGGGGGGSGGYVIQNSPPGSLGTTSKRAQIHGGRFDFEDGGTYCGGWEEGKAHGYGVCTGPKHQGAYSGAWNYGFEVSGVYIWPSGSSYEGQWQNGRRHGLGVEQRGRLIYRGEWTSGYKGRYGVRQSTTSTAKYEGTWANGLQDGYGSETYADGGSYQGQWQEGKRHGYGVRTSAPFGLASHYRPKNIHSSMTSLRSNENADPSDKRNHRMDDIRGGFVLKAKSDEPPARRNSLVEKSKKGFLAGLKIRKQRSTGDLEKRGTVASGSMRSTVSAASWISTGSSQSGLTQKSIHTDSNASFTVEEEQLDPSVVETYMGEWKRDKRDGYGISERSDGLKYEGEWHNNKKHGYGVTTFRDGTIEEGKYKNNVLITSQKKKHLFLIRSRKFRERIEASVSSAQRASKIALQKADIAISRTATARGKAEYSDTAADHARIDCETAVATAREFAPDFKPTVLERFERLRYREKFRPPIDMDQSKGGLSSSSTNSPSNQSNSNKTNLLEDLHQQQQHQQQQQSLLNRRSSAHHILVKQQSVDYSQIPNQFPNSIYSQDYSSQMNQQQDLMGQNYAQPMPQQQSTYQFQQQQPPGLIGNYTGPNQPQQSLNRTPQQSYGVNYNPTLSNLSSQQQQFQQQQQQQQQHQQQQQFQHQQSQMQMNQQTYQNQYNDSKRQMYGGGDYTNPQMDMQQQKQQQQQQMQMSNPASSLRRNSKPVTDSSRPMLGTFTQSSIDHFDHYKRPPSRDSSVDRYTRAASRLSGSGGGIGSRQASVDRTVNPQQSNTTVPPSTTTTTTTTTTTGTNQDIPEKTARSGSIFRGQTPQPGTTGNGTIPTGTGASRSGTPLFQNRVTTSNSIDPVYSSPNQPFEDVLLRQRTLGQDIIPSPAQPKRTESLYLPSKPASPAQGSGGGNKPKLKSVPINVSLQRKKSLPDVQELPRATEAMSREEVSALGSARREEIRRQIENSERLKANPLLYLVSPPVKDWFSRQQLVLLVLIVNVALAIMFFKMLT